jgi:hypothetical protein
MGHSHSGEPYSKCAAIFTCYLDQKELEVELKDLEAVLYRACLTIVDSQLYTVLKIDKNSPNLLNLYSFVTTVVCTDEFHT